MNLVLDIGNTRSKYGVFEGMQWRHGGAFDGPPSALALEKIAESHPISNVAISNVGTSTQDLSMLGMKWHILMIDQKTPSPFKTKYTTPLTLGIDRICGALAAMQHFPDRHNLVIDIGTCITYDIVGDDGWHLGGGISPGFKMRLKAMHQFTARLPEVEFEGEYPSIGTSTDGAMRFGSVAGTTAEINGLIHYFKGYHKNLNVILTGGDHSLFAQHIENPIFAAPNLVLEGINIILLHNLNAE